MLLTIAAWLRRAPPEMPAAPLRLVALTTLTGSEYGPTFSPDGSQVAFAWDGEQQDNSDIYVKLVGSSDVRRLTTHAAVDSAPQWSPDGKWIAYARSESPTSNQHPVDVVAWRIGPRAQPLPLAAAGHVVSGRTIPGCGTEPRRLAPRTKATGFTWSRSKSASRVPLREPWPRQTTDGRHFHRTVVTLPTRRVRT